MKKISIKIIKYFDLKYLLYIDEWIVVRIY